MDSSSSSDVSSRLLMSESSSSQYPRYTHFPPMRESTSDLLGGRKVKTDPVMSTGKKVGIVVAWFFAIGLVTVAVLASHGTINLASHSWAITALQVGAGVYGSSLALFSLGLIPWAITERKERQKALMNEDLFEDSENPFFEESEDFGMSRKKDSLLLEEEEDLEVKKEKSAPIKRRKGESIIPPSARKKKEAPLPFSLDTYRRDVQPIGQFYDLENPRELEEGKFHSTLPKQTKFGHFAVPNIGLYRKDEPSFEPFCHHMAVRLPPQQLEKFPAPLQKWCESKREVECHFVVFKSPEEADAYINLSMHGMACSEYNPSSVRGTTKSVNMTLFPIQGLKQPNPRDNTAIPWPQKRGMEGGTRMFIQSVPHIVHPEGGKSRSKEPVISFSRGKYARIYPSEKEDVSSCYIGAEIGGKAIAIHAVILNDKEGEEGGSDLLAATEKKSVHKFLKSLNESDSSGETWAKAIRHTFSDPEDLEEEL